MMFCAGALSCLTLASRAANPDPCDTATWASASKPFSTGNVSIPGTTSTVSFDATLTWEQKTNGPKICKLRNPSITINGTKKKHPVKIGGADYTMDIEIEGFSGGDFFKIDGASVDGSSYGTAAGAWSANATTTTTVGGATVSWTWKDLPQPTTVSIAKEGNLIELKHTSPGIIVRAVYDSAGNSVTLSSGGVVVYPGGFSSAWSMAHKVQTN